LAADRAEQNATPIPRVRTIPTERPEPPAAEPVSRGQREAARVFLVPSGENFRAVLAFCRALRRAGLEPAIVASSSDDPIFRTAYARHVVEVRTRRELALDDLAPAVRAALVRTGAPRCVLAPTSAAVVRWALLYRAGLARMGCDLPLPYESIHHRVADAAELAAFCRQRGVNVPRDLGAEPSLPCVARPRRDGNGFNARLLRTPAELARFRAGHARSGDFIFEEPIEGASFSLLFHLPRTGEATVYSQENLARQRESGAAVLARAATLHRLAEAQRWENLLRAAGFDGLVQIELLRRGDDYVLMSATPQFWDSLQLCVDGCPALLMNYIAEHAGVIVPVAARRPAVRTPRYAWTTGMLHGAAPRAAWLRLSHHWRADVFLRRDSWRQFVAECFSRLPVTPPRANPADIVAPAVATT